MLMKLLKYEWKTTARVLLPVGAGVLGFSLLTGLMNLLLDYPKLPESWRPLPVGCRFRNG